jgi:aminoglycoside phosphotransferase
MLARSLPHDPALPTEPDRASWPAELQLLLGPDAAGIVTAAAAGAGAELGRWSPRTVSHQPGSSTVVQYDAELRWPDREPTGETIVAATGARIPDGADVLDDGTTQVGVWRWPIDPGLPGLTTAMDPVAVAALLDDLGIDGGAVRLQVRAYRPGRRAVIEATGRRGRLFLKVVRPKVVEALHATHRSLAAALPVPESVGWTADGVVVLTAMPGRTLRELLRSSRSDVPHPSQIGALLDRLPVALTDGTPRADHFANVDRHARAITSVLPDAAMRLDDLRARLAEAATSDAVAAHPVVAVHGDLYEAQLLVVGGRFSGLLDVDTAGAGLRADDWANLCAHLSVLTHVTEHTKAIRRYGAEVLAHAEAHTDRDDLRARIAAAIVGLATGPFRVLERNWPASTVRRLDLAAEWLDGR